MKRLIVFFIALFTAATPLWAASKHHNDLIRNIDAKCMENKPGNSASDAFNYNEYTFCDFPNVIRCAKAGGAHWVDSGCEQRLCPGLDYNDYDSTTMRAVPSDTSRLPTLAQRLGTCWGFECQSEYVLYNGTCITQAECRAKGSGYDTLDGVCAVNAWCEGTWRDEYAAMPSLYNIETIDNCRQLRCKTGCMRSATDHSCITVNSGTLGGTVCGPNGIASNCPSGYFSSSDGSDCLEGKIASMAQMRTCFDCPFEAGFRECIESNGAIRTKCNDSSATIESDTASSTSSGGSSSTSGTRVTCDAGTYLPAGTSVCASCTANYYCPGGTYTYGLAQGRIACPSSYPSSAVGNKSINTCYKECTLMENALRMTGSDYYSGTDSCRILTCASNYRLSGNNTCIYAQTGGGGGSGNVIRPLPQTEMLY